MSFMAEYSAANSAKLSSDFLHLFVEGAPRPKGRPRARKNGQIYTPVDTLKEEARLVELLIKSCGHPLFEGPLWVWVDFFMPIPQSWPKKKKRQAADGYLPHIKTPDLDNLEKLLFDAANGILWMDDSQIVKKRSTKLYGELAGIALSVLEVPPK